MVEGDRKRIQNLRLFTRVEIQPMPAGDGLILLVLVAERFYILPQPILYRNERDWSKLSYGLGVVHQNFRGLDNDLFGSFWLGYNPGMDFFYNNPWIGGGRHLFFNIRAYSYKIRSKSLLYDRFSESHKGVSLGIGKRWGYHTYLSLNLKYRRIRLPSDYVDLTLSESNVDRLPSLGMLFRFDSRDLHEYARSGWFIEMYVDKTSDFSQVDFVQYGVDIRKYVSLYKRLSFGVRSAVDLSGGFVPVYERQYIGYDERLRGRYNYRCEGDNRMLASWEFRFPIVPMQYVSLGPGLMPMGAYGNNIPFGISGALFVDTGTVWNSRNEFSSNAFVTGFGAGLHLHFPYIDLLRFEYGFNSQGYSEFIVDVGVSF
jgi:outer membrane protein assembly factor BamA